MEDNKIELEVAEEKRVSIYKLRFSEAPWFDYLKQQYILQIGAGGIGSWVALCLSRIGCDFTLYDMDVFESHNLGGQFCDMTSVNKNKAEAVRDMCYMFSGKENSIDTESRYTADSPTNPIVISAFDNMAGRKIAFENWVELLNSDLENKENYIFIDGRLLAEEFQVYTVRHNNIDQYRETLFSDSEVAEISCSLKATTHCSMGIASEIISVLTNFATNRVHNMEIREVPFMISKVIPLLTYDLILQ